MIAIHKFVLHGKQFLAKQKRGIATAAPPPPFLASLARRMMFLLNPHFSPFCPIFVITFSFHDYDLQSPNTITDFFKTEIAICMHGISIAKLTLVINLILKHESFNG